MPTAGIHNIEIPLNSKQMSFNGYSRAYATPPLAWYNLNITSTETGLVGFLFNTDSIGTIAVNISSKVQPALKSKIYGNEEKTGLAPNKPKTVSRNSFSEQFYGMSTQYVYSPVSSAETTKNGMISIQKL